MFKCRKNLFAKIYKYWNSNNFFNFIIYIYILVTFNCTLNTNIIFPNYDIDHILHYIYNNFYINIK